MRLTRRCSRRLALQGESATGLFPPFHMVKIPQETAIRALARRG